MADLDSWAKNSMLSNFADDTQSIIISGSKVNLLEITTREANNVIRFFGSNNLVNNAEKAVVLHNSNGKGQNIIIENIGGEILESSHTEKLLGLYINSQD